jgi:hypothetical protein
MRLEADDLPLRLLSRQGLRISESTIPILLQKLEEVDFDPDVVILETFRRVFPGDENSAKDVAALWHALTPLLGTGRTVIISHHMRKPSPNGRGQVRDRFSGSTDILAGADSALAFEREAQDCFIVEHVKCREAEEAEAFAVSFVEEDSEGPVRLLYEGSRAEVQAQGGKTSQAELLIREFLRSAADRTGSTEMLLAYLSTHGLTRTTGERSLRYLTKRGQLCRPRGRGFYRLVEGSHAT